MRKANSYSIWPNLVVRVCSLACFWNQWLFSAVSQTLITASFLRELFQERSKGGSLRSHCVFVVETIFLFCFTFRTASNTSTPITRVVYMMLCFLCFLSLPLRAYVANHRRPIEVTQLEECWTRENREPDWNEDVALEILYHRSNWAVRYQLLALSSWVCLRTTTS